MKEIMTRARVRSDAQDQGIGREVGRLLTLAEQVLELKPDEKDTVTVGFRLRRAGAYMTIFRMGPDYEQTGRADITFPFNSWPVPENRILEGLRRELLATVPRLDKGGAEWNVRLEINPDTIDDLIDAICVIHSELRRAGRILLTAPRRSKRATEGRPALQATGPGVAGG